MTKKTTRLKVGLFVLQIALLILLFVVWFVLKSGQSRSSLWTLFLYCLPSEFMISIVAHEPVMIYFSHLHPPALIAVISAIGTVLVEGLNYIFFRGLNENVRLIQKIGQKSLVARLIRLFNKHPFAALMTAGLTPIPFYPFRFLVVLSRYPLWKYLSAVAASRTPRFLLICGFGSLLKITPAMMVALLVIIIAGMYVPLLIRLLLKGSPQKNAIDKASRPNESSLPGS